MTKSDVMALPYGMLLTRLYEHVCTTHPYAISDLHHLVDHVMIPLTKGRALRIKLDEKRPHPQTPSESSRSPGRMPTKIELTLEQSQQGVSNDVLVSIEGVEELKRNVWIKEHPSDSYVLTMKMEILLGPASNKLLVGDSLNLPDDRIHKDGDGDASFQLESDSLPHDHAQTTKTYYKHQDSRIMKAQELKTKTSAQTLIYKIFLQRYQVYQGRLLASFQDDAKYEHVGQDTRSQGGKDDQDGRIKS
ncbi:hypothetical protein Tco_1560731 [Tanacetum coccineum]